MVDALMSGQVKMYLLIRATYDDVFGEAWTEEIATDLFVADNPYAPKTPEHLLNGVMITNYRVIEHPTKEQCAKRL
jgi:hypothetical protein